MQLVVVLAFGVLQLAAAQPNMVGVSSQALDILKKMKHHEMHGGSFNFPHDMQSVDGTREVMHGSQQLGGGDALKIPDFMKDLIASSQQGASHKSMSPLQMVNDIGENCRDVPALIKQQWHESDCNGSPTEMFDMFKVMLTAFVHKEMGELQELPADFKNKYNAAMARTCSQPKCQKQLDVLIDHTMNCEIAAVCAIESKWISETMCKATIGKMVKKTMDSQMQDVCAVETGTKTYCNEADIELLFADQSCWTEIYNPIMGCSPKCQQVWSNFRSRYPVCSSKLADKVVRMQNMVQGVASSLMVNGGAMPGANIHRSPDEICTDLTFHIQQGSAGQRPWQAEPEFEEASWGTEDEGSLDSWGEAPPAMPAVRPMPSMPATQAAWGRPVRTETFHV